MRWTVFVIAAFLAMAMDALLGHVLSINSGGVPIRPSVLAALAVFIALAAPRLTVLWACLLLGLLVDLSSPLAVGSEGRDAAHIAGPYALGFVFGGYFVCQIRVLVFRRRVMTIGVLAAAFSFAAALVAAAFFVARSGYSEPLHWKTGTAGGELLRHLFMALYSGLLAIPIGWLLLSTSSLWSFQGASRNRSWR